MKANSIKTVLSAAKGGGGLELAPLNLVKLEQNPKYKNHIYIIQCMLVCNFVCTTFKDSLLFYLIPLIDIYWTNFGV